MESVLEGFAEYFSKDLSQKTLRGMKETAKKHKVTGSILFGYRKGEDNTCVPDERIVPAVRKMFEMYIDGEKKEDIAEYLNSHGYRTAYGNKFTPNAITPLIRNPRYTGRYKYADLELRDEGQRIVSDEIFEKAQAEMRTVSRGPTHRPDDRYILSRILYCGYCRNKMHGECGRGRSGKLHRYYSCVARKKRHECDSPNVRKDDIENYVLEKLSELLKREDIAKKLADLIIARQQNNPEYNEAIRALGNNLSSVKRKITNLMNAIEDGITTPTTKQRLLELEEIKAQLEYEIANKKYNNNRYTETDIIRFFKSLNLNHIETWQQKQRIITQFINRIYLWENKILILYNFTDKNLENITDEDIEQLIKDIAECSTISPSGSPSPARTDDPAVNSRMLCQTLRLTII